MLTIDTYVSSVIEFVGTALANLTHKRSSGKYKKIPFKYLKHKKELLISIDYFCNVDLIMRFVSSFANIDPVLD